MYPKTITLIATIFLLSFKNLSSMDPQTQPKDAQSVSRFSTSPDQIQTHVRFIPGLAMGMENSKLAAHATAEPNDVTRISTTTHETKDRTDLSEVMSRTSKRQPVAEHSASSQHALKSIEQLWHTKNYGTPSTTSIEDMRLLAYRDDIKRLPTPSIQPIDPLINVDPSQIARLRQLVQTYSMYDHQRVDAQKKASPTYQQEVTSPLDETYGDIVDVISELPTDILPDAYDQETMILNIRQILKRHAQLQRLQRYQELQQKLSVAIAATSHAAAAARESSVDSVNT